MSAPTFPLGRLYATPGALDRAAEHDISLADLLARHLRGDWGDLDAHDKRANRDALKYGSRILSAYGDGEAKLYVITEADRSSTTILCPEDY